MSAYSSYDAIIYDLTSGKGKQAVFSKASLTTTAAKVSSLWGAGGYPAVGTNPSGLTARAVDSSTTGAITGIGNATTANQTFMTAIGMTSSVAAGVAMVVDRLLDYGSIQHTSSALQSMTNTATIPRYTTGAGTQMFMEITTLTGAQAATCTVTYTNQAGTGGRATTFTIDPAAVIVGGIPLVNGFFIPLYGTDTGVRSIESVQFSAANSAGVSNIVICMPICIVPLSIASSYTERDMVLQSPKLFQLYDGAALQLLLQSATTSSGAIQGMISAVAN